MRISDWSSDVCSSDLHALDVRRRAPGGRRMKDIAADSEPFHDYVEYAHASDNFRDDVLKGLARKPRRLPSKYFYDACGSRLFDRIRSEKGREGKECGGTCRARGSR